jgi:hypothetical protein
VSWRKKKKKEEGKDHAIISISISTKPRGPIEVDHTIIKLELHEKIL